MGLESTLVKTGAITTSIVGGGIVAELTAIGYNAFVDDVLYSINKWNPKQKQPVKRSPFSKKKPAPTKTGISQEMIINGVGFGISIFAGIGSCKPIYNSVMKGVPTFIDRCIITKDVVTTLATDPDDLEFEEDDE